MKPGWAVSPLRTAPPGSGSASRTRTSQPSSARRFAATRPFGPAPMTTASATKSALPRLGAPPPASRAPGSGSARGVPPVEMMFYVPPERVYEVLSGPYTYAHWVVGSRSVDVHDHHW